MIVFTLTMPHRGSWNNKWSGERSLHVIVRRECDIPRSIVNKSFRYRWDDGWEAEISVKQMKWADAKKLEQSSDGFCGYDWMVKSIIATGSIQVPTRD